MDGMSVPSNYPRHPDRPSDRRDPQGAPWPGLIPLRPLRVGEIYAAAFQLVRTHAAVLCVVALAGSLASTAAVVAILTGMSDSSDYFDATWITTWTAAAERGEFTLPPAAVSLPLAVSLVIGFLTTIVVSGLATAFAADDAVGSPTSTAAAFARLRGRWPVLVAVSLLVGVMVFVGLVAFVLPGLVLLAMLLLATPVAVLEKAGPLQAIRRSFQLSAGHRARIFGIAALAYVIASLIGTVVLAVVPAGTTIGSAVTGLLVQSVVSAVTVPWTAAVVALLYVDTRIRKENLAASLIRASMKG